MGVEIERKFLVKSDSWKDAVYESVDCRQGYLICDEGKTVRVRVIGEKAFLTIKGETFGSSRPEFEYEIPVSDAEEILQLCSNRVEKSRCFVEFDGMEWEIDVFSGENEGLVLAEIELESEDQPFVKPSWTGEEVTGDPRYYNAVLAKHPFRRWRER